MDHKEHNVRDTTSGGFIRQLLILSIPLMLGAMCQNLYTLADTAIVGRFIGVDALAAVGNTGWLIWPIFSIPYGLAQAGSILGAQRFGQKDFLGLRRTVYNTILVTAMVALVMTLVLQLAAPAMLRMIHTSDEIFDDSLLYLRICYGGILAVGLYNAFNGLLRSLGNTRTPFVAMLVASAVNIGLDLLFVCVFHWSVAGAAIATVISQILSAVVCGVSLRRVRFLRNEEKEPLRDWRLCGRLCRMGLPLSAADLIIGIGGVVVQNQVNSYSVSFVAGYSATTRLYGLMEASGIAWGSAFATFVGQNFGAGKFRRIRQSTWRAVLTSIGMALFFTGMMYLFAGTILSVFADPGSHEGVEVMAYGKEYLLIMSTFLPILYVLHLIRAGLQALGSTIVPLLSGVTEFTMRVCTVMFLPGLLGYRAVFFAEVIAWTGAAILLCACYFVRLHRMPRDDRGM